MRKRLNTSGLLENLPIAMHRQLLGLDKFDSFVDHVNGNGLDNRRQNIRLATSQDNMRNKGLQKNNKTGYRGVSLTREGYFRARIKNGGKETLLGIFKTAKEASVVYEAKAAELFGKFYKEL